MKDFLFFCSFPAIFSNQKMFSFFFDSCTRFPTWNLIPITLFVYVNTENESLSWGVLVNLIPINVFLQLSPKCRCKYFVEALSRRHSNWIVNCFYRDGDECNYCCPLSAHKPGWTVNKHPQREGYITLRLVWWCINCNEMPTQSLVLSRAFHILFLVDSATQRHSQDCRFLS